MRTPAFRRCRWCSRALPTLGQLAARLRAMPEAAAEMGLEPAQVAELIADTAAEVEGMHPYCAAVAATAEPKRAAR